MKELETLETFLSMKKNKKVIANPAIVGNFQSDNHIKCESNRDRKKTLPAEEYLNKIRPNLKDTINNLKKFDARKIQLTMAINFISSTDNDEDRVMDSKNRNHN